MPSPPAPLRLHLDIRDLPSERIDEAMVDSLVRSFAVARVRCPKHGACIADTHVAMKPGKATVTITPCCARPAKTLKLELRKLKALGDDRVPDAARPGQRLVRPGDPPPSILAAPVPSLPFTTTGTGRKVVGPEVASLYAQAGQLQHITRINGKEVDVYTANTAGDEVLRTGPNGEPPPLTVENIRIQTRPLIAEATKLALRQRHPLSDYTAYVDWDTQYMHVLPARDLRATFVEGGGVPDLVEELDANSGETLLVFLFANDRYDRTLRITNRGFVQGHEGAA